MAVKHDRAPLIAIASDGINWIIYRPTLAAGRDPTPETAFWPILTKYDLSRVREDVLKGVYQQLIDPKVPHDLGEYYTPDWLCRELTHTLRAR